MILSDLPLWRVLLRRTLRQAWFRCALYCLGGVAAALLAWQVQFSVPEDFAYKVGADAVGNLLGILASSMLTVTTFSLTIMVTALGSASSGVTPRATTLLMEDRQAHNALATFLGAFMFAVVGIIALSTRLYGPGGRLVLLGATILVIALIVVTLLRWMHHLARFGRVGQTILTIEQTAAASMRQRRDEPLLGGVPRLEGFHKPVAVHPRSIGYVQHVDMAKLMAAVKGVADGVVDVEALPGAFVHPATPLAFVDEALDARAVEQVRDAFLVGETRSFEQDPRFGVEVLAEIASRSLPPTAADAGTAIAVTAAVLRVLSQWPREAGQADPEPRYTGVRVPALDTHDLLADFFGPVAREGAGLVEVVIRLQKALAILAALSPDTFGEPARRQARRTLLQAEAVLVLEEDRQTVATLEALVGR